MALDNTKGCCGGELPGHSEPGVLRTPTCARTCRAEFVVAVSVKSSALLRIWSCSARA